MSGLVARLRRHHRQRTLGQSFVEFALILPVFLLFLAGALDLGRVFYANITLNNAAREGAFQAAKTPQLYSYGQPCDQATNRVVCSVQNESLGSMVAIAPADIDMTCSAGCLKAPNSLVTVEVRGKFRLFTPLLSIVFGGQNLDLTSSAVAQVEYLPDPNVPQLPPGPVAAFTADDPTNDTAPWTVTFDASASTGDPTAWNWDFDGDGNVDSLEESPSHTYTAEGKYTVSLTVINQTTANTKTRKDYVVIGTDSAPPPPPNPEPPTCVNPPNVVGQLYNVAQVNLQAAGFNNVVTLGDLSNGKKDDKIQAQNPDHTQCVPLTDQIKIHYRPKN